MELDQLIALMGFALTTSITPGPNNMMVMASGANFGYRRSLPHLLGISLGHMFMIVLVGLGLFQLFEAFPVLDTIMKGLSIAYLLFLAWKIANAAPPDPKSAPGKPFTFLQAAAFQWVNPKAWFMALTAITVYAPEQSFWGIAIVAGAFATVNMPSVSCWALLGQQLRRFLTTPSRLQAFNWTMAVALVASLVVVL